MIITGSTNKSNIRSDSRRLLPKRIRTQKAKFTNSVPSHQYPLGVSLLVRKTLTAEYIDKDNEMGRRNAARAVWNTWDDLQCLRN